MCVNLLWCCFLFGIIISPLGLVLLLLLPPPPTFSSLQPLAASEVATTTVVVVLLRCGQLATSSSNAVSIVCLSTWIWLLWDPFVFIFNLRAPYKVEIRSNFIQMIISTIVEWCFCKMQKYTQYPVGLASLFNQVNKAIGTLSYVRTKEGNVATFIELRFLFRIGMNV